MDLKSLTKWDETWVTRLRRGHWVYLPKENEYAQVVSAYEPPEPGTWCGRIMIQMTTSMYDGLHLKNIEQWFTQPNGRGLNGSQIIIPVEGNCPDDPPPLSEPWVRHVERELEELQRIIIRQQAQIDQLHLDLVRVVIQLA